MDLRDNVTTNSTGHVTDFNLKTITMPTSPTVYSGWLLTGDAGTSANITAGATVDVQGGTGISTSANGFILDIVNDGGIDFNPFSSISLDKRQRHS